VLEVNSNKEIQYEHNEKLQAFLHSDLTVLEADIEGMLNHIENGTEIKMLIAMGLMGKRPLIKESDLEYINCLTKEQAWLVAVIDYYIFKFNEHISGLKTLAYMNKKTANSGLRFGEKNIESTRKILDGVRALKGSIRNNDDVKENFTK